MEISVAKNKITLFNPGHFTGRDIFECGQVFRYQKTADGYEIISRDKRAIVVELPDKIIIDCEDTDYFINYFDLKRNYSEITAKLSEYDVMNKPLEYGQGIRILRQDLVETIFSFIISANNNIKRIQLIIGRLSKKLGKDCGGYHAFPELGAMAAAPVEFYTEIGMGYRAPYFKHSAEALHKNKNFLKELAASDTETARNMLLSLMGVGNKVADCILLFGLNRTDVFPVDVWIEKVYYQYFAGENPESLSAKKTDRKYISKELTSIFGGLAGYAQQYLFYYKRSMK